MAWSTEEISQLDLKLCREVLAEEQAKLFDSLDSTVTPNVGTGVEELNRCWVEGVADRWSMLRRYLEIFGASKNTAPSNIVVDPIASMEVHKGVYRQAFIRRLQRNGITYIVQTLRRGLMQSPKWDEARIFQDRQLRGNSSSVPSVSDTTSDTPEKYVFVEFFGIDPDHEVSFVSGLTSDTYTNPSAGGQMLSGEWHNLGLTLEPADDGTLTGRLLLARPQYTLNAFSDIGGTNESDVFYLWNVPKTIAQQVLDDYRALAIPGSTATASYNTDQGVVDIVLRKKKSEDEEIDFGTIGRACSYSETATVTYNVSDPFMVPMPSESLMLTANIGITYRREVTNNGDGTYNVVIIRRERITQGPLTFNAEVSFGRNISAKETRGWKTGYSAYDAAYPQASPPAGTTYTRDIRINEDCSLDIVDRTIVVTPLPRSGYQKTALGIIRISEGAENGTQAASDALEAYSPAIGETAEYEKRINPDGSITYARTIITPPELSSTSQRLTILGPLQEGDGVQNLNNGPNLPQPSTSPSQGETIDFQMRKKQDGTWDTEETKITSPVLDTYELSETIKSKAEEIGTQNRRDPMPTPTAPSIGKKVRFRRQKNQDGTWTYTEIIEDSAPNGETLNGRVYEIASCRTLSETEVERNIAQNLISETPNTPQAGTIRVVRLTENQDGSWDREVIDRVAPALTSTETVQRAKGGIVTTIKRNLTTPPPPAPAPPQGVTRTQRIDENPDCSQDETLRDETSPELEAVRKIFRADQTIVSRRVLNARAKESEAQPVGPVIKEIVNDENPDGTFTTTSDTRTPIAITASVTYESEGKTVTAKRMLNYSMVAIQSEANALNPENVNNVSLSDSEFPNLFHATLTSAEPRLGGRSSAPPDVVPLDEYNYTITLKNGDKYAISILLTRWRSQAKAHVEGQNNVYVPGLPTVGIFYEGRGVYRAVRVLAA